MNTIIMIALTAAEAHAAYSRNAVVSVPDEFDYNCR